MGGIYFLPSSPILDIIFLSNSSQSNASDVMSHYDLKLHFPAGYKIDLSQHSRYLYLCNKLDDMNR